MGKPQLILENSTKANSNEKPQTAAKTISFSAFLFSIFISVALFYLSPSTLFSDTKFWFFISNAIILIVAADSGAFSSSKQKHDLYEEFLVNSSRARSAASFVAESPQNVTKGVPETETSLDNMLVIPHTRNLEAHQEIMQEKTLELSLGHTEASLDKKKIEVKSYHQSNSDKTITAVLDNENKSILQQSEMEKCELKSEEENEFSAMPVEELNRRVEEFIRKFNRQIRLQEPESSMEN